MQKKIYGLALGAALLVSVPVSADWLAEPPSATEVTGGAVSASYSLTSAQYVHMDLSAEGAGSAALTFGLRNNKTPLLKISPLPIQTYMQNSGSANTVNVSITPFLNTSTGARYYIIQSGAVGGCRIIAWKDRTFKELFDASSVPGSWTSAEIAVRKTDLLLTLKSSSGTAAGYSLQWDGKAETFKAVLIQS